MRVFLTGGSGLLGSAILRLNGDASQPLDIVAPTRRELDLTDQAAVCAFISAEHFDVVIHAAAKVGGIGANVADPARYLSENLALNLAVVGGSASLGIPHLLNIGSSNMYPKDYRQPLVEGDLLKGPLEPANEPYALAKIVAARHCDYISRTTHLRYRTIIPCNLYGPGDNYSVERSQLIASVIAKIHSAKSSHALTLPIWGDGSAKREILYVDDLASWILNTAARRVAELPDYLNVGAGTEYSVEECYRIGTAVIGYRGGFVFDLSKPAGMRQKLMDSSLARSAFGWSPSTSLHEGIRLAYESFLAHLH